MARESGIVLDLTTTIVNVGWDDPGLAVEFGDHAQDAPPPPDEPEE